MSKNQKIETFQNTNKKDFITNYFFLFELEQNQIGYYLLLFIVLFCFFKVFLNFIFKKMRIKKLFDKAALIRKERDQKITKYLEDKKKPSNFIEIIKSDCCSIMTKIKEGKFSILDVYLSFSIRAAILGLKNGWLADVCLQEGYENAKNYEAIYNQKKLENKLDELFNDKPLFGLPISVKDCISVKGLSNTIGFISFSDKIYESDGEIVRVLRNKGAIPFVHTSVPQGMLAMDSSTYLWGVCNNAWNIDKIAGGSSGGEGGLVGSLSSPIGLGSDIGGSIRIPAVLNGLYGFKPTSNRISKQGGTTYNGTPFVGFNYINSSWGPLCRSAKDVIMITKELFGNFPNDPNIYNKKYSLNFEDNIHQSLKNENTNQKDLKKIIGYYHCTHNNESSKAIINAVIDVKKKLTSMGYELKEFDKNKIVELIDTGFLLLVNSGAAELIPISLDGEPNYYYYNKLMFLAKIPKFLRIVISYILSLLGQKRASTTVYNYNLLDRQEYLKLAKKFLKLKSEFLEYWNQENYHALICPVLPVVGISHGSADNYNSFNHFNFLSNMIDLPACTIPMYLNDETGYETKYKDQFSKIFKREAETSKGLPVGIQVVGYPMQDEIILDLVEKISTFYKFEEKYSSHMIEKHSC